MQDLKSTHKLCRLSHMNSVLTALNTFVILTLSIYQQKASALTKAELEVI